jgi:hypothetical protein
MSRHPPRPPALDITMPHHDVPLDIDTVHHRMIVGDHAEGKAHILHCNYYNNYLLRTIWKDAGKIIDAERLLIGAAAEQSYFQLAALFAQQSITEVAARKAFAERFYSWQGFGTIDLAPIDAGGGTTMSTSQHYAEGWVAQFGRADSPVGFMTSGWLAGAAAAIYDAPQYRFSVSQHGCTAMGIGHPSIFELRADGANYTLFDGRGVGPLSRDHSLRDEIPHHIDSAAVGDAILTLPLFGSAAVDGGLIRAFDVLITWHPHQYYDRVSFECLRETSRKHGAAGREMVEQLLEEAGHRCGFRTFGGIWRSPEWQALVAPMCANREDWVMGMIAIINRAGWGRIQCTALDRDGAVFVVHDDYESVGYLNLYGPADFAATYLMPGGLRGLMNLVYNGDIMDRPLLTERFYDELCRRPDAFATRVEQCRAMGDDASVYRVTRKTA